MKEYLDLLEIKDITDLPLGDGAPPSDDELINCHSCRLANDRHPHSMQPCPSRNNTWRPGRPPRLNYDRISRSSEDFIFRVNEPYCSTIHVLRAHLRHCLEFSVSIQSQMIAANLPPMPIGYNTIARVFNNEWPNPYRLSTLGPDGHCPSSNHPEPPPSIFFGTNEPEAAQPATDPHVSEMGELLFERELR